MSLTAKSSEWKHKSDNYNCPVCRKPIYATDSNIEYVKTKRGTNISIHTDCVRKWGDS